jgi:hypothetical protein
MQALLTLSVPPTWRCRHAALCFVFRANSFRTNPPDDIVSNIGIMVSQRVAFQ